MSKYKFLDNINMLNIKDGILSIPGKSREDMTEIRKFLHKSLLDYKIPHTKIIGVDVSTKSKMPVKDMATPTSVGFSYIMLGKILADIILPANKEIKYGSLVLRGNVSSDGQGITTNGGVTVKSLLKGKHVIDARNCQAIVGVTYTGTGNIDFNESSKNIASAKKVLTIDGEEVKTTYKPVRADYDLSKYINIRPFTGGSTIEMVYYYNVNEDVLEEILLDYIQKVTGGY